MSKIIVPESHLTVGGVFDIYVNGELVETCPNLVVDEGLSYLLGSALDGGTTSVITTWYVTAFKGNVTPAAGWTASNFDSTATEITATDVTEATRQTWTQAGESSQQIDNYASKAEFTVDVATLDLYGVAIASASAFETTSGTLLAASAFGSVRSLLQNDVLGVGYRFTMASSG